MARTISPSTSSFDAPVSSLPHYKLIASSVYVSISKHFVFFDKETTLRRRASIVPWNISISTAMRHMVSG
jgi:hypothetical protein